jgi:hypothetical protein
MNDGRARIVCNDCGTEVNVMGRDKWGGLHPGRGCAARLEEKRDAWDGVAGEETLARLADRDR